MRHPIRIQHLLAAAAATLALVVQGITSAPRRSMPGVRPLGRAGTRPTKERDVLSQDHNLARSRVAAVVAAVALLASGCSEEPAPAPPAPAAEETASADTTAAAPADAPAAAPADTAAGAAVSPCDDPGAEDLGGGLVEVGGVVYEVSADACVPKLEEPATTDAEAASGDGTGTSTPAGRTDHPSTPPDWEGFTSLRHSASSGSCRRW